MLVIVDDDFIKIHKGLLEEGVFFASGSKKNSITTLGANFGTTSKRKLKPTVNALYALDRERV